jgi:hypothetical protein
MRPNFQGRLDTVKTGRSVDQSTKFKCHSARVITDITGMSPQKKEIEMHL